MATRTTPSPSIGTCPCPFQGCELTASVHKFRARSDNPARHRYAGRLYCLCPKHGRIESQEWILENAKITNGGDQPANGAEAAEKAAPAKPAAASSTARSQKTIPAKEGRGGWGWFD